MDEQVCRLPGIVDAMPDKAGSTIFCRRDGLMAGVPYPQCHRDALLVAAALRACGVLPGDRVAIHGTTSYEWVLADLGCLLVGALSVALYPSAPAPRVAATARESRCGAVFTDRPEFVSQFTSEGLNVIFLGPPGPAGVPSVQQFLHTAGAPESSSAPRHSGPFTIVSTSGTLSEPKLFAVHSAPLLYTMDRFAELYGLGGQDRLLLYLPLSHLPQRMMLYWGLGAGMDFILSDPAHIATDTAELSPTLHVAVPRSLEHLHWRTVNALRRKGCDDASAAHAYRTTFGRAIKAIFVGSAPSDKAVLDDLLAAGLPIYEVYGTTELGMIALNTPGATRTGTVGRAIPWGRVRLDSATNEILVQTPTPFLWGRMIDGDVVPAIHEEGAWWPTGDVGHLDEENYLSVRGRLRDFVALSSGEKVFVRPIEDAAAQATDASVCVLTRIHAAHLGALLFFDPTAEGAAERADAEEECRTRLNELNERLHPWERIRAFAIVWQLPSIEEGSVTETMKLRRHKIEEIHGRDAAWRPVREG